jgi:hypothetical protein
VAFAKTIFQKTTIASPLKDVPKQTVRPLKVEVMNMLGYVEAVKHHYSGGSMECSHGVNKETYC